MELCDLDLEKYLKGNRSIGADNAASQNPINLVFVSEDCGLQLKLQNAFTILSHITAGLKFAHEHKLVHRDLKPGNGNSVVLAILIDLVLYSHKKNLWKIADFGFTSQARSSKAVTSIHARGTHGYRAPELIIEPPLGFTYAVDVWAVGCIFYELLMDVKPFSEDYKVREYYGLKSNLTMTISDLPDFLQSHFSGILQELLHYDRTFRPPIRELIPIFQSYIAILNQDVSQSLYHVPSIPDYPQWKKLVGGCKNQEEVLDQLTGYYKSTRNVNGIIQLLKALVYRHPVNLHFQRQLEEVYKRNGDCDVAITGWKDLVNKHPDVDTLQRELAKVIEKKGDAYIAHKVWKELAGNHPDNRLLEGRLIQAINEVTKMESRLQAKIVVLKEMIDKHPHDSVFRKELKLALHAQGKKDDAITIWKELVDKHPDVRCLQVLLQWACDAKADKDQAIGVWKELVDKHPDAPGLQERLRWAFKAKGDKQEATTEWKKLKDKHPTIGDLNVRSWCVIV